MVNVASLESLVPSFAVQVKVSVPMKFGAVSGV